MELLVLDEKELTFLCKNKYFSLVQVIIRDQLRHLVLSEPIVIVSLPLHLMSSEESFNC